MKFEVYDETKKPEPVCRLKLFSYRDGEVTLVAVDENGRIFSRGDILSLRSVDGKVIRHQALCVPGIKTDEFGRIQEKNNVDN